jgi:hypothetical protein
VAASRANAAVKAAALVTSVFLHGTHNRGDAEARLDAGNRGN